jgi:Ni,Fe-hydrogenase III large subunit
VTKLTLDSGDVFARAYLRHLELQQSACLITEMCESLPAGILTDKSEVLMPEAIAVSIVEGWRGGIVHAGITDKKGNIKRFKIKDPSFNNWFGLAIAARGNGISDFPLCNKSFDLSYCGNDL